MVGKTSTSILSILICGIPIMLQAESHTSTTDLRAPPPLEATVIKEHIEMYEGRPSLVDMEKIIDLETEISEAFQSQTISNEEASELSERLKRLRLAVTDKTKETAGTSLALTRKKEFPPADIPISTTRRESPLYKDRREALDTKQAQNWANLTGAIRLAPSNVLTDAAAGAVTRSTPTAIPSPALVQAIADNSASISSQSPPRIANSPPPRPTSSLTADFFDSPLRNSQTEPNTPTRPTAPASGVPAGPRLENEPAFAFAEVPSRPVPSWPEPDKGPPQIPLTSISSEDKQPDSRANDSVAATADLSAKAMPLFGDNFNLEEPEARLALGPPENGDAPQQGLTRNRLSKTTTASTLLVLAGLNEDPE